MREASHAPTLRHALWSMRRGFAGALLVSLGLSLLMLGVPLYSMQLYDRVLSTGHGETLFLLSLLMVSTFAVLGALEVVRQSVLARLGTQLADGLASRLVEASIAPGCQGQGGQALRDLSVVRQTLTGPALQAVLDAPWLPISVAVIWLLHPALGLFALSGAVLLWLTALANELVARGPLARATALGIRAQAQADAMGRRADAVRAMGMLDVLLQRFKAAHRLSLALQQQAAERGGVVTGVTRSLRLFLQSGVMGLGAWLVLQNGLTGGSMFAVSILLSRALAPVEQLVGAWRQILAARDSASRLDPLLTQSVAAPKPLRLPAPRGRLRLEGVWLGDPRGERTILREVSFALEPGELMGVVGPSAAGKSSLCRVLAGAVSSSRGHVRLDEAEMAGFERSVIGRHIGYLPQDPALFAGTIAQNIARMAIDLDAERIVAAAQLAGVHEMILRLPQGYETMLDEGGLPLSGGQRQRIGLARALYGEPKLIVLDEPNSNLDGSGEIALLAALAELKKRAATIVAVTHRPSLLALCDKLLVLEDGAISRVGPREKVMATLVARPAQAA